jgi:transposase
VVLGADRGDDEEDQALRRLIKQLTETEYSETHALIEVYGVGQLTTLTYVLTLGNKERFQRSRDVGCYAILLTSGQKIKFLDASVV